MEGRHQRISMQTPVDRHTSTVVVRQTDKISQSNAWYELRDEGTLQKSFLMQLVGNLSEFHGFQKLPYI